MIFLESVRLRHRPADTARYPFSLPLVQGLEPLTFHAPVTFFVGENGAGKSTILEALGAATGAVTIGGAAIEHDPTLAPARELAAELVLSWRKRTRRGFFLRAEDFINFGRRTVQMARELEELEASFDQELTGYGRLLAKGAARGQREALARRYGEDPDAHSHGESFLQIFQQRFVPGGLYLLDEPDTALSPQRQLALLALLKQMVAQEAQFIIATHAPIVLAYPGAQILLFEDGTIRETAYDELDGVQLTRSFLAQPDLFLRHL